MRQWIESDELRGRASFALWQELHFGNAAKVAAIAFDLSGTNGVLRFQQPADRPALIEFSAGLGASALWWPWSEGSVPGFPIAPLERRLPVTSLQSIQ